jgi:hypothetical protein
MHFCSDKVIGNYTLTNNKYTLIKSKYYKSLKLQRL